MVEKHSIRLEPAAQWREKGFTQAVRPICTCGWESPVACQSEMLGADIGMMHLAKVNQCAIVLTNDTVN